jgi:hypothetical protein
MITKAQAAQLQVQYIASLPDRINAALTAAATSGQTSLTVSYAPASPAQATAFINGMLVPAGWTVSNRDDVGFTFTIS